MIEVARRRGHRDGLGPARRPAAAVRLLRARPELPQLRHGPVPHRPVRRGTAEGRVRRRRRRDRGPQPGPRRSPPARRPLRPRPRHPRGVRADGRGRDHRLPHRRRGEAPRASPPSWEIDDRRSARSNEIAADLADALFEDFGSPQGGSWAFVAARARGARALWERLAASRRAASTARTSRCCTAPTWASTTTTSTSSSTACARACPTAGAAR